METGLGAFVQDSARSDPETDKTEETWVSSFDDYARDLLRIQTKKSFLIPFVRNEVQKIKARIKKDIRSRGLLMRLIILKARQFGMSTDELMEMFHEAATKELRNNLVVTHRPDSTSYLFDVVKRAHEHIPERKWKPELKKSNARELIFKDVDSAIRVGTAGEDNIGSATVVHRCLLSELAKYPRNAIDGILTSLFQAIPKTMESELVIESTAQGVGGEFHTMYWAARYHYRVFLRKGKPDFEMTINYSAPEDSQYSAVFFPWFVHDEYQMDPPPDFKRTKDNHPMFGNETALVEDDGVTNRQLAWRRHTIVNECRKSLATFNQEFPHTPESAFLSSGRIAFDPAERVEARRRACKPPMAHYRCQLTSGQWIATKPDMGNTDGLLQVWEEPIPGRPYIVSGDVAEGDVYGDFDSSSVIDQITGVQVAHWHGKMPPDQFGMLLDAIGKRYNYAWMAPERNNHGYTTITKLVDLSYPNIIPQFKPEPGEKPKQHYGWWTGTSRSAGKTQMIDELAAFFRENPTAINCAETLSEMLTFKVNDDGTMGAEEGHYDDRVMDLAIGISVKKFLKGKPPKSPAGAALPGAAQSEAPTAAAWS